MSDVAAPEQLAALFRKTPVIAMSAIERTLRARSRRSLFRDLSSLGYLTPVEYEANLNQQAAHAA